ncbi:MAG: hypothetical protein IT254_07875 [Chitinophagaceae bacterium]|nr:hypothetical protein [Bacteroidota bacterium]MCC6258223.1 hypothetical protein [Chitinophagaceae bacterium]MCW5916164.1 hypothetical protein [Ferruginibacter sp.]
MKREFLCLVIFFSSYLLSYAQSADTAVRVGSNVITLSEVIVDKRVDVARFISRIKNDSSFYKAFKNLRILGYTSLNDIRMLDKKGRPIATLYSKTKQIRKDSCRSMVVLDETHTGDMYNAEKQFNYYTANMYASLFFTNGRVCGETNIVGDKPLNLEGKSGMEKHKEQLKMLFFNPGRRIRGLPFMSSKTEIFDAAIAGDYDMQIDYGIKQGIPCIIFRQIVKPGHEDNVVIDEMITWFDEMNYDVISRNYHLRYDALFYDFDVRMEVEMGRFNGLLVPVLLRYNGNWKAITKKRERAVFTATLFDFNPGE